MTKIKDNYRKYFNEYIDIFEPLFQAAFEKSQINLILSLLAWRGSSDDGWEPYENTVEVALEMRKQHKNLKRDLGMNMSLWVYVHLIESSEQYELIANLIKTTKGEDYNVSNQTNKNFVNLTVEQKIDRLTKIAVKTKFENVVEPFRLSFNSRFRNAIAHADYSLKKTGTKGITIIDDAGYPKIFEQQETNDIVNRALALHTSINVMYRTYIGHYSKPQKIMSSKSLGGGVEKEVDLIIRKKHGVIGISWIGGYDETGDGKKVPFTSRIAKPMPYELKLIEKGQFFLPPSRPERANRLLDRLPARVSRKLVPLFKRYYIER
jgi:hypothetical protein